MLLPTYRELWPGNIGVFNVEELKIEIGVERGTSHSQGLGALEFLSLTIWTKNCWELRLLEGSFAWFFFYISETWETPVSFFNGKVIKKNQGMFNGQVRLL